MFSIRVTNPDGSLLSFEQALRRSDMGWAKGLGAGTPLVGQFLMAAQHYELSANAKTFWDWCSDAQVSAHQIVAEFADRALCDHRSLLHDVEVVRDPAGEGQLLFHQ